MVQYQPGLDGAFAALADPTRRSILARLGHGSATITELAEPHGMSLTGMKKHVRILEDARLVQTEKAGRARRCSLGQRRLEDVQQWLDAYRELLDGRLDRLGELLEGERAQPASASGPAPHRGRPDAGAQRRRTHTGESNKHDTGETR